MPKKKGYGGKRKSQPLRNMLMELLIKLPQERLKEEYLLQVLKEVKPIVLEQ